MGRAFTEEEKVEIKNKLLEVGKSYFERFGFKGTNIDDITQEINIGKGSFYNFYASKEELFVAVFEEMEKGFQERILKEIELHKFEGKEGFKYIMGEFCEEIQNSNILKTVISSENLDGVWRNISDQKRDDTMGIDIKFFNDCYNKFSKDKNIEISPKVFVGMARGICAMVTLKSLIGEDIYIEVIENMIDAVAERFL